MTIKSSFRFDRINKLDRDVSYWQILSFVCPLKYHVTLKQNWMQGWSAKETTGTTAKGWFIIGQYSANKISLPQGQSYTERKYLLTLLLKRVQIWQVSCIRSIMWNVIKFTRDRLKANECRMLLGQHQEYNVPLFSLENTELRLADLSENEFPINFKHLITLKIALLKFTYPKY